ncbi:unnamed protein product [Durusdinium trenchii]|uniref:Protein kinase domain-containing protein n=2 Tax=Durusdinium trenchii TaxID=1381693 RepID=A0ABP0JAP2_9DINO
MVSNDSLVRAEKRLGVPAVVGRYHRALERQLQDDYELGDKELFLSMDHPRVARLMDVYETEGRLSLVMECMEGGELFTRVMDREVFPEKDAAHTAWQMLLALNYIHSHGIVHRDIKLENFMYARKDTDHLKLIDFGLSKVWEPNTKMEASCGTLGYIAPEVLNKTYSSKCDLWSLGVIVYILLSGCMPFAGSEYHQITCIMSGMYDMEDEEWTCISRSAKDFVAWRPGASPQKGRSGA